MSWVKVVFYNLAIMFALLGVLFLTPPTIENSSKYLTRLFSENLDKRASLFIYDEFDWSDQYFAEHNEMGSTYYDYITWRRNDYAGETINIVDGVRHTSHTGAIQAGSAGADLEYWFFGGSTTWGTGVNDENTYPSVFADSNGIPVKNFGESGYIARQSLALLQNTYIAKSKLGRETKRVVVFYDGVNEVLHRCRNEARGLGTGREAQIQQTLYGGNWSFYRTFAQLINYLGKISAGITTSSAERAGSFYDCASDPLRAGFIADTLVSTWQQARTLAQANGDEFIAILQPVSFIGSADVSYLDLSDAKKQELARQYETVYPLIVNAANASDIPFINLTDIYDRCTNCYIDFCHVGPQAHQMLVERMTKEIANIRTAALRQ